jgi:hypothetical protein
VSLGRFAFAAVATMVLVVSDSRPAVAHGLGGGPDLPFPLSFFVVATAVALVATFALVGLRWTAPRLQAPSPERDGRHLPWLWNVLGGVGAFLLVLTLVAGAIGVDNSTRNPAAVIVFVGFWLLLPFGAALVVDLYPAISPWRRLPEWLGMHPTERPDMRDRLGYWPATAVFLAFTWFELVAPDNGPRAIGVAALVFTLYMLAMSWWLGTETATQSGDGFAVYARFLGAMAPFRFEHGVWRRGTWLRGLTGLPERTGIGAFVVAMIGTVLFDGASSTEWWVVSIREPVVSFVQGQGWTLRMADVVAGTIGWAVTILLVGAAYVGTCWVVTRLTGLAGDARRVARRFAHTLVPVGFAYAFAHYFTLILVEGQLFLSTFSDPFGLGWDLFGSADRRIDFSLVQESQAWVWFVQVGVLVTGHVAGVVLSRDRALADLPPSRALAAQYAMLSLLGVLAALGVVVLAAG